MCSSWIDRTESNYTCYIYNNGSFDGRKYTIAIIPPYIWMLSSDWLIKEVFSTISEFFPLFHHRRGICPWEFRMAWYLPKLRWLGKFASPLSRYFSQLTLTNRIYLYNIAVTPVERVMLFVLMYVGTSHNARYP
jgi:hypothetical protein